jgi:hypothetical protein
MIDMSKGGGGGAGGGGATAYKGEQRQQVVTLLAEGYSEKAIADHLGSAPTANEVAAGKVEKSTRDILRASNDADTKAIQGGHADNSLHQKAAEAHDATAKEYRKAAADKSVSPENRARYTNNASHEERAAKESREKYERGKGPPQWVQRSKVNWSDE